MKILNKTTKAIIIMLIPVMMLFALAPRKCEATENVIEPLPIDEELIQVKATEEPVVKVAGLGDILRAGNKFISNGKSDNTADDFANELAPIGSILAGVGIVVFMVVLAIMAIKWIMAKPDDKAKLKQAFVGYVVAAIVFFGAIGIWRVVRSIMENIEGQL